MGGIEMVAESSRQIITIAGILAGFSFTALIQLSASPSQAKLNKATIISFAISVFCFLITMMAAYFFLITLSGLMPNQTLAGEFVNVYGSLDLNLMMLGILSLLVAISLAGWTYSAPIGITITIGSVITEILIIFIIYRLLTHILVK